MTVFLNGCFIFNFSNLLFNVGNFGGSNASSIEDASQLETELYEDGPIDLPVTIAKLDAPDVQKISVEVDGPAPSVNAGYLESGGPLYQSSTQVLIINGSSGAVDVEQTPSLLAYSLNASGVDSGSAVVVDAAADGSFQIRISIDDADFDRGAIFAGVTADLAASSSYLKVIPQISVENGVERRNFVVVTTNAANLLTTQRVMGDADGYYYLSLDQGGGNQAFLRRNLDGTEVEVLAENSTEEVNLVSALTEDKISYVNAAGELKLLLPSSAGLSLVTGEPMDTEIVSFVKTLTTLSSYEAAFTHIGINQDEDGILVSQYGSGRLAVDFVRTVSGSVIPVIQDSFYDDAKVGFAAETEQLYAFVLFEGRYIFYRANLSSNVATAWGGRETLDEDSGFTAVHSVHAAPDGSVVVIDAEDEAGDRVLSYWTESSGLVQINDPSSDVSEYANAKVSPDGTMVLACRLGAAGEGNQFYFHRIGTTDPGEMKALTVETGFNFCDEEVSSYYVDPNSFAQFYRSNADGTEPQHALINLSLVE